MKKIRILAIIAMILGFSSQTFADSFTLQGSVVDEKQAPIEISRQCCRQILHDRLPDPKKGFEEPKRYNNPASNVTEL